MRRQLRSTPELYTCVHRHNPHPTPHVHTPTEGGGREEEMERGGGRKIEDEMEKRRKGERKEVSYPYTPLSTEPSLYLPLYVHKTQMWSKVLPVLALPTSPEQPLLCVSPFTALCPLAELLPASGPLHLHLLELAS